VYSRKVADEDEPRSFGVSGRLWHGVLVFFDRESGSLWTQLDGRSIQGDDAGEQLRHAPSTFTTWSSWKREHPETLVLEKSLDDRERTGSVYADYLADPDRLWMERLGEGLGGVGAKDVVYGIVEGNASLAVTERLLSTQPIVNAVVGGTPVAWLRDASTGFPRLVDRRLDDRVLLLGPTEHDNPALLFRDVVSGEVHGFDELRTLRTDRSYWYAWRRGHPESAVLAN